MAKFKLVTEHTFKWPVKIKIPSDTRIGTFDTQQIDMTFRAISQDEASSIAEERKAQMTDKERSEHEDDVLRRSIISWDEKTVLDDDNNPVPFSPEALSQALQMPWVRIAAYEAYANAISGGPDKGN